MLCMGTPPASNASQTTSNFECQSPFGTSRTTISATSDAASWSGFGPRFLPRVVLAPGAGCTDAVAGSVVDVAALRTALVPLVSFALVASSQQQKLADASHTGWMVRKLRRPSKVPSSLTSLIEGLSFLECVRMQKSFRASNQIVNGSPDPGARSSPASSASTLNLSVVDSERPFTSNHDPDCPLPKT